MSKKVVIHWFRQDLRLADNPSLSEAARNGTLLPIFICDEKNSGDHHLGSASQWWLHNSLIALNESLNGKLSVYKGDPERILSDLIKEHKIAAVYWNRCYEPWRVARDTKIKSTLKALNVEVHSFNGSLLLEPWQTLKKDNTPYKVFTPFYKNSYLNAVAPREPKMRATKLELYDLESSKTSIDDLTLKPAINWYEQFIPYWKIGEAGR